MGPAMIRVEEGRPHRLSNRKHQILRLVLNQVRRSGTTNGAR
jgi:hypothetical protein